MVSFFGIKFGDKKKKSDSKAAQPKQPQEWKRIDQNALGEGQFFGKDINKKGVVNGSIRSVSRANTPMSMRTPYTHNTHNMAASSMFDLSHVSHSRNGSGVSMNLRAHASDAALRTRFGAANGSSLSLAVPGPGFGSRPTTPGGKAKPWVNPLDVHFGRNSPTVPPAPRSPLVDVQSVAGSENEGSVFGEDADEMVEAMMAAAKKKEDEEKAATEKERELEKRRETARLEMERLERQKSAETKPWRPPQQPEERRVRHQQPHERQNSPHRQMPMNGPGGPGPGAVFRGNVDQRPGSRGGMRGNEQQNAPSSPLSRSFPAPQTAHQGPPRHAPPTQSLPHPPMNGSSRNQHQGGPVHNPPARGPRPNGPMARSLNPSPLNGRPYSPGPNSPSFRGPAPIDSRSQSPAHGGPGGHGNRTHPLGRHESNPQPSVNSGLRPRGPDGVSLPLRRAETVPLSGPGPMDDGPAEQFARPIIQNVSAKRDTMQAITPGRHSLSMKIEELEKTLIQAQVESRELDPRRISTGSSSYSVSITSVSSMSGDDEPILPSIIHPAPLRTASAAGTAPMASSPSPTEGGHWQQPNLPRGPLIRGPPPRRPTLDEYGVTPVNRKASNSRPPQAAGARSASGMSNNPRPSRSEDSLGLQKVASPSSRSNTPQFRRPNWPHDESPVVPAVEQEQQQPPSTSPQPVPLLAPAPAPAPIVAALSGFQFDFGNTSSSSNVAPPTPDSTTWPLPSSPTATTTTTRKTTITASPTSLNRPNIPAPLNFNFSPDAYSREQGPWTPPLRSMGSKKLLVIDDDETERPSTATGFSSLAPAPSFAPPLRALTPVDVSSGGGLLDIDGGGAAAGLGIGIARGPSIRDLGKLRPGGAPPPPRPPPSPVGIGFGMGGGPGPEMRRMHDEYEYKPPGTPTDRFGTGFI